LSTRQAEPAVRRVDTGPIEFGDGLEVLLSAVFQSVAPGESVDVVTGSRASALELPGWARLAGNDPVDQWSEESAEGLRFVVRLRRGYSSQVLAPELPPRGAHLPLRARGELHTADLITSSPAPIPKVADPTSGLIPLGAVAEAGGPDFYWQLNNRDELWAEEIADLTERATALQWDASRDVPWEAAIGLNDDVERAVAQVTTFLAANEYVALYVPAKFLAKVNPAFVDVLLWLSGHVHDEARHVEVFTKRALMGGDRGYALASTQLSLHSLLEEDDFSAASLLLNVLGEGTFLDLLSFIARTAPDQATATAARLAHRDEQRHVHFGISHVRRTMRLDPSAAQPLKASVEARAAKLATLTGLSSVLIESLTIMAAGSLAPAALSEGAAQVKQLTRQMEANRVRRLLAAGFDDKTARYLSDLHTPNLM
jgi:hypothetical protein